MAGDLLRYRVLSFDCYGTLIDWESGIWSALQPMLSTRGPGVTRAEALHRFGGIESRIQTEHPGLRYPEILARVHRELAQGLGGATTDVLDQAFGGSVPTWPAFPDSASALASLATRVRLVVLSNVDRASFDASSRMLGDVFDAVYTAEDIGSYKPDPANFDFLLSRLADDFATGPESVLHVAQSLFHDHAPAKAAGLDTAWIDRQHLSSGGNWGATSPVDDPPVPDFVFFTMEEMARAVEGAASERETS